MALRDIRYKLRQRTTAGGSVPTNAFYGEPFVNIFDGILYFSVYTGGSFVPASGQPTIFEVGSKLSSLNINNNFVVSSGGTITEYANVTNMAGKFLSGTPANGMVLADISDISGQSSYVQDGLNTYTGGTAALQTVNVSALTIDTLTVSGAAIINNTLTVTGDTYLQNILSGGTNLNAIFAPISVVGHNKTYIQNGLNTYTGGTVDLTTINISGLTIDNLDVSGTTVLGSSTTAGGSIVPSSGSTYNLGSPAAHWQNVYADNLTVTGITTNLTPTYIVYVAGDGSLTLSNHGMFDMSGAALTSAVATVNSTTNKFMSGAGLYFIPAANGTQVQFFSTAVA